MNTGASTGDTAILLTYSKTIDKNTILPQKIHKITDYSMVASSGIISDVNFLTDRMFEESTDYSYVYGSEQPTSRLALSIADYVHSRTLSARYRPLGIRMCIASYDDVSRGSILEIDAIGNLHSCQLSCLGELP